MHATTEAVLDELGPVTTSPAVVGVQHDASRPFAGYADAVAVLAGGHRYVGWLDAQSPYLLRAFFEEVTAEAGHEGYISFTDDIGAFCACDAVVLSDEALCNEAEDRFIRPDTYGVAVLNGREHVDEWGRLAEDLLLYDGGGRTAVRLVWAPADLAPDALLDVMQQFRQTLPAHSSLDGTLAMARGFLGAANVPHAWGDGFLLSKGAPEPQRPGHIRWVPYTSLDEVATWLAAHTDEVTFVAAEDHTAGQLGIEALPFGEGHRLSLVAQTEEVRTFLAAVRH